MRVAVLDDYQGLAPSLADWSTLAASVEFFQAPIPREQLPTVLGAFDALVLMRERTAFPRAVLEQLPALRLLITTGMRNRSVDIAYLSERGVTVCGTSLEGYGVDWSARPAGTGAPVAPGRTPAPPGLLSTAELAWALIFALVKRVTLEDRAIRRGVWQQGIPRSLAGMTLGLLGLGRLGAQMVAPAHVFGMEVIAWSEHLTPERARAAGASAVTKQQLLERADVVSIHLVLSERTRGLIGGAELGAMKPSAILINTSRGPIVEQRALIDALRSGRIAGAGLDVYDQEPLPSASELLALENTVLLPHLGYVTVDGLRFMYRQCVEDVAAFLAGAPVRVIGAAR